MHAADQSAIRVVDDPLFEVHDGALIRPFVFDTRTSYSPRIVAVASAAVRRSPPVLRREP